MAEEYYPEPDSEEIDVLEMAKFLNEDLIPESDDVDDDEMPNTGVYIITITLDHDKFEPIIDFGGAPMYMVKSLLSDAMETLQMLSPPVTVQSNGDVIFSANFDFDPEEDDD
jgi:hypothetical protein